VDDKVAPGEKVDLLWRAVETSGPGPGESADTKLWIYHGHKGEVADSYAGLFGAVLVVAEAATSYDDETLLPTDGSDEMFLYFSVMNEGGSFHLGENIDRVDRNKRLSDAVVDELKLNGEFQESNLMHSINGFMYCNSRPLKKLTVGKPVRLYLYSLGSDVDFHSISLGNEPLHINGGTTRGTAKLLAGTFTSAVAVPLHSGRLELRCSIDDHIAAGMRMLVDVAPGAPKNDTASAAPSNSTSTTHYIAADKLDWNYARYGKNLCTGDDFGDDEAVFTAAGPDRPGPRYVKARYSAYEDATFRVRKESGRSDFFGIVGPMLHFEVGDTVTVVFRNNLPFAANLNIVGLEELKTSLRSFADGVKPGAEATYTWTVPESSGPGPADLSSVSYVYYSSVNATVHAYAGLTGAISVSAPGGLDRDTGFPKDVDVVVPLLFNIFRENDSPFIAESLDKYATGTVSEKELVELQEDDGWLESNTMHAANGFMYCNNPVMEFAKGARVRWIVFGYGSESSMHSPFFDSDAIVGRSRGGAGVQIFPYTAETVDVVMATPGETSVGCVVVDHRAGGMFVRIRTV
jgi:hephaestin